MKHRTLKGENVLIYGAGHGGHILLKEILENKRFAVNLQDVNIEQGPS
jgi:hypothetical protein